MTIITRFSCAKRPTKRMQSWQNIFGLKLKLAQAVGASSSVKGSLAEDTAVLSYPLQWMEGYPPIAIAISSHTTTLLTTFTLMEEKPSPLLKPSTNPRGFADTARAMDGHEHEGPRSVTPTKPSKLMPPRRP